MGGHEQAVAVQLSFLRRHLLDVPPMDFHPATYPYR
jgi:hypothetical protein